MAKIINLDNVNLPGDDEETHFVKGDYGCIASYRNYGVVLTDRKVNPLAKGHVIARKDISDVMALLKAGLDSLE